MSCALVAVTVTEAGAGYGDVYRPLDVMVPGLSVLPDGAATDQVTPELVTLEPLTVALNCCVEPIVTGAGLGVTTTEVTAGAA